MKIIKTQKSDKKDGFWSHANATTHASTFIN